MKKKPLFQGVNLNLVPSGILSDYGFSFINLDNFAGQTLHDSNRVDLQRWRFLYGALETSKVNSNFTLTDLDQINQQLENITYQDQVLEMVIGHVEYHRIKANAISQNLMYVSNNKLYDTSGRTQSPYEKREMFAVCPKFPEVKAGGVALVFKPSLFFSNTGKTVASIQVDYGNGWQTVQWNTPHTAQLQASTQNQSLKIRITYTDSSQYLSHALIKVKPNLVARYDGPDFMTFPQFQLEGLNDFQNIPVATVAPAYLGVSNRATVTIQWGGNGERVLDKPLIVLEGFDGWRILTPGIATNNYSVFDFLESLEDARPIYDLNDELDLAGYDLIFVDWENGTDYIQRNAFLVEHLIEWVNLNKVPLNGVRQENVVMGLSMGGLIGRYALRDMELKNLDHETRLFISFDSPQAGANVPLGYQAMVKHLASKKRIRKQSPDIARAKQLLDEPASQQMLFYQVQFNCANPGILCGRSLRPFNSPLRQAFMQEMAQMGYPLNTRNIAVSNGAECGNLLPIAYNAVLLRIDGSGQALAPWLSATIFNGGIIAGTLLGGPIGFAIGFTVGSLGFSNIELDFTVRALPNQQVAQIYKGRIIIKKKVAFLIPVNTNYTNKSMNSEANMLPLDNAPGGVGDIVSFGGDIVQTIQENLPFANIVSLVPQFCFVPTVSALDVNTIQGSTLSTPYVAGINPTNPSKFSNFKSQEPINASVYNGIHLLFTARNAEWLFNEMEGVTSNILNCSTVCTPTLTVTGANIICNTGTFQYSVAGLPAGANVTWSATGPVSINPTTGVATYGYRQWQCHDYSYFA